MHQFHQTNFYSFVIHFVIVIHFVTLIDFHDADYFDTRFDFSFKNFFLYWLLLVLYPCIATVWKKSTLSPNNCFVTESIVYVKKIENEDNCSEIINHHKLPRYDLFWHPFSFSQNFYFERTLKSLNFEFSKK